MLRDRTAPQPRPAALRWSSVLAEVLLSVANGAALFVLAMRLPPHRSDASFVFLLVVGLYAAAALRTALRVADFLSLDCPSCASSFHGFPEQLPRPFRKGCAHCGAPLP